MCLTQRVWVATGDAGGEGLFSAAPRRRKGKQPWHKGRQRTESFLSGRTQDEGSSVDGGSHGGLPRAPGGRVTFGDFLSTALVPCSDGEEGVRRVSPLCLASVGGPPALGLPQGSATPSCWVCFAFVAGGFSSASPVSRDDAGWVAGG